jgi:hypothetical protein
MNIIFIASIETFVMFIGSSLPLIVLVQGGDENLLVC